MGVSGQHHALAALYPLGKGPPVPIVQKAWWTSEPVWTQRLEEDSFSSAGIEPRSSSQGATLGYRIYSVSFSLIKTLKTMQYEKSYRITKR
jgi:hypothetical protein